MSRNLYIGSAITYKNFQKKFRLKMAALFSASIVGITSLLLLSFAPLVHAAACSPPATTYGTDTMTVSIPSTITYSIWVDMQAPASSSNSIMLQVDGSTCYNVGGNASMPLNSWTWVNYQNGSSSQTMQLQMPTGNNTLELIGTEPGVLVSNILILGDTTCVPTGDGSNCTTGQPVVSPVTTTTSGGKTTTSAGGSSKSSSSGSTSGVGVDGTQALSPSGTSLTPNNTSVQISAPVEVAPTYTAGETIKEVHYYVNNKEVYTATKAPYTYKLNTNKLTSGKYALTSKTVYTSGTIKDASEVVYVNHSFGKNMSIFLIDHIILLIFLLILIGFLLWEGLTHKQPIEGLIQRLRAKYAPEAAPAYDGYQDPLLSNVSTQNGAGIGSVVSPSDPDQQQSPEVTPTTEETPISLVDPTVITPSDPVVSDAVPPTETTDTDSLPVSDEVISPTEQPDPVSEEPAETPAPATEPEPASEDSDGPTATQINAPLSSDPDSNLIQPDATSSNSGDDVSDEENKPDAQ